MVRYLLALGLLIVLLSGCAGSATPSPVPSSGSGTAQQQLQAFVDGPLAAISTALAAGDIDRARALFAGWESVWQPIEEGVKAVAPDAYTRIETAASGLEDALVRAPEPDPATVKAAVEEFRKQVTAFIGPL